MTHQFPHPQQPNGPYQQPVYYPPQQPVQQIAVVNGGSNRTPHTAHLILTILTCGAWAPIWIIDTLIRGK